MHVVCALCARGALRICYVSIAGSSNGRTQLSESWYLGSSPSPAALLDFQCTIVQIVLVYARYLEVLTASLIS